MKYFSCALVLVLAFAGFACLESADLPNILWITSEDNGPHLGCYGDAYAAPTGNSASPIPYS